MNSKIAVLLTSVLMLLGGTTACDVPVGSERGDSAGNNQPSSCQLDEIKPVGMVDPVAQVEDSKYVYDIFVSLLDDDCNEVKVVNPGSQEYTKPLHIYVGGHITDKGGVQRQADYMGGSQREKDADSPYHLRAFVSPRQAPHDMIVIGSVNVSARPDVDNRLDGIGFIHCHINRDGAPIRVVRGSSDRVSHTVQLSSGWEQASCHFLVGVS